MELPSADLLSEIVTKELSARGLAYEKDSVYLLAQALLEFCKSLASKACAVDSPNVLLDTSWQIVFANLSTSRTGRAVQVSLVDSFEHLTHDDFAKDEQNSVPAATETTAPVPLTPLVPYYLPQRVVERVIDLRPVGSSVAPSNAPPHSSNEDQSSNEELRAVMHNVLNCHYLPDFTRSQTSQAEATQLPFGTPSSGALADIELADYLMESATSNEYMPTDISQFGRIRDFIPPLSFVSYRAYGGYGSAFNDFIRRNLDFLHKKSR